MAKDKKPQYRPGPSPKIQKELDALKKGKKGAIARARDAEMALDYANNGGQQWNQLWAWAESITTMGGAAAGGLMQGVGDEYMPEWETSIDCAILASSLAGGVAITGVGWATGMPRIGQMGLAYFTGVGAAATAALARDIAERGFDMMDDAGVLPEVTVAPAPLKEAAAP